MIVCLLSAIQNGVPPITPATTSTGEIMLVSKKSAQNPTGSWPIGSNADRAAPSLPGLPVMELA